MIQDIDFGDESSKSMLSRLIMCYLCILEFIRIISLEDEIFVLYDFGDES